MQRPVNVFAQKTPNPNAYKFASSLNLVQEGCFEFLRTDYPTAIPVVDTIFERWDTQRVFIADNFVTVLKNEEADWAEFSREVRDFLAQYLREAEDDRLHLPEHYRLDTSNNHPELNEWFMGKIMPATAQDGGAIYLKSFEDGQMTLVLAGACNTCPYAHETVQKGIVTPLLPQIGKLKKVLVEEPKRPA